VCFNSRFIPGWYHDLPSQTSNLITWLIIELWQHFPIGRLRFNKRRYIINAVISRAGGGSVGERENIARRNPEDAARRPIRQLTKAGRVRVRG
jgi:hypothetical protein